MKGNYIKIIVSLLSVLLIIGLIVTVQKNYSEFRDFTIKNEQTHLLSVADTISRSVETFFLYEEQNLKLLAHEYPDEIEISEDKEKYIDFLKEYHGYNNDRILEIRTMDKSGNTLIGISDNPVKKNLDLEDIENVIKKRDFVLSKNYFDEENPYVYLLYPIIKKEGIVAILSVKIDLNYIYMKYVKHVKVGEKGYASIKDSKGVFLMHPHKEQLGYTSIDLRKKVFPDYSWESLKELLANQTSGEKGFKIYSSIWITDEVPEITTKFNVFFPVYIFGDYWLVTVVSDYNEVVDRIKKNYYITISIIGLIMIGVFFIGSYIYIMKERERKFLEKERYLKTLKELNKELEDDIEERKTLEKELLKQIDENKKNELLLIHQSRNAAMGEMIGNIAHQWRQPLNSISLIVGNIEDLMIYDYNIKEFEKEFEKFNLIVEKMSETIDDFRNFFKPESNKENFEVSKVIDLTKNICSARLNSANIECEIQIEEGLNLNGYFNQLSQAILNIVNNSIDALIDSNDKKQLFIKSFEDKEKNIVITITDTGNGISDDIKNKIYEPYFSTKSFKNGTGLGLYMSKMIIEKYFKGSIKINNIKEGTEFEVILPNG